MPKHTIEAKLVAGLIAYGHREVPSRSSKYREFTHPKYEQHKFVGSRGALRKGKCVTRSISMENMEMYQVYLKAGEEELNKQANPATQYE